MNIEPAPKPKTTTLITTITITVSITALLVSAAAMYAQFASNKLTEAANNIANTQATIARNAITPEFIYLGPQETVCTCNDELAAKQPESHYDLGFIPQFAKLSGFAENMDANAQCRYEIYAGSDYPDFYDTEEPTLQLIIRGDFLPSEVELQGNTPVLLIRESYSKINIEAIRNQIESLGYKCKVRSYCDIEIQYDDVLNEKQSKFFCLNLDSKNTAQKTDDNSLDITDALIVDLDWQQPNLGLSTTFTDDIANEVALRAKSKS